MKMLKDIFTSKDNQTFSMSKLAAFAAVFAMIYQFIKMSSIDFQGFGVAVSALIAALAAKSFTDKDDGKDTDKGA